MCCRCLFVKVKFLLLFLFWNSQPQAITWTQLSRTEFCVRHPMTAVNWAPIGETPRTSLKSTSGWHLHGIRRRKRVALRAGDKLFNILDSNAAHCIIVHNLKCERLSYFKLPWNPVSVIWIYVTFYLAFVLKKGDVLLYPCVYNVMSKAVVHFRTRGSFMHIEMKTFPCISFTQL